MLKKILLIFISILTLIIIIAGWALYQLDQTMQEKLAKGMFEPPTEFYSAPLSWVSGQSVPQKTLNAELNLRGLTLTDKNTVTLRPGQYSWLDRPACVEVYPPWENADLTHCLYIKNPNNQSSILPKSQLAGFNELEEITSVLQGRPWVTSERLELEPLLFAQYFKSKPILQSVIPLRDYPPYCLKSVLAIEDPKFLDHQGVSPRGFARAVIKNVILGDKSAGGGSTITQQLMKIFFLTSEQTYTRKAKEIGMAIIFETRIPKDRILEAYLNMIYMGQSGPFAVKGFAAASQHYFRKNIRNLNLAECASLAAILNSPGRFSPFRYPDRTKKRRRRVLTKLKEEKWISQEDFDLADNEPLPTKELTPTEPAPYFVDAVRRQLRDLDIDNSEGVKVYTTMVPQAQSAARKAVKDGIAALENWFKHLQENRDKKNLKLQGVLISANPTNGHIEALVGGRDFKSAPYNRAVRAHRQVGSVIKPFVYLAALEKLDFDGNPYTPMTLLQDEKFTYEYGNQSWSPRNYGEKYFGEVPMYFSLKNSLNSSTAKLGIEIGLTSIIDVVRRMGIESKIDPLPALTLGAYELYPNEVLRAYTAIARFGSVIPLSTIARVTDLEDNEIWSFNPQPRQASSPDNVATLIGMMKQTVESGTAQAIRKIGFKHAAAGKTGTTSDARDSWFGGITPYHVAIAWVGYDENEIHGLTGASGAVPMWTRYMMSYASRYPNIDFEWPENAIKVKLSQEKQFEMGYETADQDVELIFRGGTEP